MDKKEMKQQYKQAKFEAGVYMIKNLVNNRIFLGTTANIRSLNGVRFQLETGSHINPQLQEEFNEFGADKFSISVLEIFKEKENVEYTTKDKLDELKKIKHRLLKELKPFNDRGYHDEKEAEED